MKNFPLNIMGNLGAKLSFLIFDDDDGSEEEVFIRGGEDRLQAKSICEKLLKFEHMRRHWFDELLLQCLKGMLSSQGRLHVDGDMMTRNHEVAQIRWRWKHTLRNIIIIRCRLCRYFLLIYLKIFKISCYFWCVWWLVWMKENRIYENKTIKRKIII